MSETKMLTSAQALVEANRCLHCYDAPCQKGCPANVDVPKFIRRIATEDYVGAVETIRGNNPFGAVCGYVCPSEQTCKKECSSKKLAEGIKISELQAYVMERTKAPAPAPAAQSGKRVAVVGGGPGGVAAAWYLKNLGHTVELFEKDGALGGIPKTQIPAFRLENGVVEDEVKGLMDGVTVHLNTLVDGAKAGAMLADFDAVYIAAGLGERMSALDMAAPGCHYAEDFLEAYKQGTFSPAAIGSDVVVIGGGNTAMDAASAAKALGAENVSVLYRRTAAEMPAWQREYEHALTAGVAFWWRTQVVDTVVENGLLSAVVFSPTVASGKDAKGRDVMKPDPAVRKELKATALISALGRGGNTALAAAFGLADTRVDENMRTGKEKVFAGGDFVNGGDTVVQAVADSKKAAQAIDAFLKG